MEFNDLGGGQPENSHWLTSPALDSPRDSSGSASMTSTSSQEMNFDPAVSRPARASPSLDEANRARYRIAGLNLTTSDIWLCKVCDVPLSGLEPAKQHYAGKSHRKAVQRAESMSGAEVTVDAAPLHCEVCVKDFTSEISARQHYVSRNHLRIVEGASKRTNPQQVVQAGTNPFTGSPGVSAEANSNSAIQRGATKASPLLHNISEAFGLVLEGDDTPLGATRPHGASPAVSHDQEKGPMTTRAQSPTVSSTDVQEGSTASIRQKIVQDCTTILENHMRQIIPELSNRVADILLEGLANASRPRVEPGPVGLGEVQVQSGNPDRQDSLADMPPLVEAASLSPPGSLQVKEPLSAGLENNLNREPRSIDQYSDVWNSLSLSIKKSSGKSMSITK